MDTMLVAVELITHLSDRRSEKQTKSLALPSSRKRKAHLQREVEASNRSIKHQKSRLQHPETDLRYVLMTSLLLGDP